MYHYIIKTKLGSVLNFRFLQKTDAQALGDYFDNLSSDSKSRFGPHPLTREHANTLCHESAQMHVEGSDQRWVIADRANKIVGYLILEAKPAPEEIKRFAQAGVDISTGKHLRLAPSIADDYQNSGIASAALRLLIEQARQDGARSIVLMGGTQSTNALAVAYYRRFGFQHVTSYWTEIENYDMYLPLIDEQTKGIDEIRVCAHRPVTAEQFQALLNRSGLAQRRPADDLVRLSGMIENSNLVVSAWKGEVLIGLSRALTDYHYACYLSDLAVDQQFQRQGLGKMLIAASQLQLGFGCKLILLAAPAATEYYKPIGFQKHEQCWVLDEDICR